MAIDRCLTINDHGQCNDAYDGNDLEGEDYIDESINGDDDDVMMLMIVMTMLCSVYFWIAADDTRIASVPTSANKKPIANLAESVFLTPILTR